MRNNSISLKDTIAAKLLTRVFYFYLLVTVSVTLLHMTAEYKATKNDTVYDLEVFQQSFQPGLATALWNQEDLGLLSSLQAMIKVPQIVGAKVLDKNNEIVGAIGDIIDETGMPVFLSNEYETNPAQKGGLNKLFWSEQNIYFSSEAEHHVGSLVLYSSSAFVFTRVQDGYVFIIINAVIKTLALWIIVLMLSKPILSKPLEDFSDALRTRGLDNLSHFKFKLKSKWTQSSELYAVEDAFNELLNNLSEADKKQQGAAAEIVNLNKSLEKRAYERTAELQGTHFKLNESQLEIETTKSKLVGIEKMASTGSLVSGLAHEVNTPIGIGVTAMSYLKSAIGKLETDYRSNALSNASMEEFIESSRESTVITLRNLSRAADLIQRFKQTAINGGLTDAGAFNLKHCLEDITTSASPKLRPSGHIVNISGPNNVVMVSHSDGLFQVITNLIMNSLNHGFRGRLSGIISIEFYTEGKQVMLSYHDNGRGMTKEEQANVFEAFYTTNRSGGGTGLGGHISFNIVTQKLKGSIDCCSSGEGATFTLTLPLNCLTDR